MNWKLIEVKVLDVIRKAMKSYNEQWVSADTLCKHVETLKPEWLKRNGSCFNRTRVEWTDRDGNRHSGGWLYPLHEILDMVQDGRIKDLQVRQ